MFQLRSLLKMDIEKDCVQKRKSTNNAHEFNAYKGLLWLKMEDENRVSGAERINQELLDRYPSEYRDFRNKLLLEIQPKLEAEFEREKNIHNSKFDKVYKNMLEKGKESVVKALDQNMDDEIKRVVIKELKYAERRKKAECKRAYAKIKNDVIKAKNEGIKICLHCGEFDVSLGCVCNEAFYCNKTCLEQHSWIHRKLCSSKAYHV